MRWSGKFRDLRHDIINIDSIKLEQDNESISVRKIPWQKFMQRRKLENTINQDQDGSKQI